MLSGPHQRRRALSPYLAFAGRSRENADWPSHWIGGQGTEPYEQKTQQSPALGFSSCPHEGQVKKYWQAFSGMVSSETFTQCGHVRWETMATCSFCGFMVTRLSGGVFLIPAMSIEVDSSPADIDDLKSPRSSE